MEAQRLSRLFGLALIPMLAVTACDDDDSEMMAPQQPGTVLEVAAEAGSFETLAAAVEAAGLTATLDGTGPFTVFAPTDDAFAALPAGTVDALLLPENQDQLIDILTYHVVGGELSAQEVTSTATITMLNGDEVTVTVDGSTVRINDAVITTTDIEASNGTIHVLGAVLLPPELPTIAEIAASSADFETLTAALEAGGLTGTLDAPGMFTVFAPTDDAFAALPVGTLETLLMPENQDQLIGILTYHVVGGELFASDVIASTALTALNGQDLTVTVDGSTVMIDDATVTMTDIAARNGVVHVIDAVLLP